jgi:hypothetical protein
MNATSRILGESEPEFSEQFKDTLALFDAIHLGRTTSLTTRLYKAIETYEHKYGGSKLTRSLLKSYNDYPRARLQDDLENWYMELQGGLITAVIQAVRDGDILVASLAQSILSGHALGGDVDQAITAIANKLGWPRSDIEGFAE